jgi:hypothetical protein
VVDLAAAATNSWDAIPTIASRGVYDPEKWAVVFKYSAVNIPAGVTVTFKNHPSRAPVVWLVDGDVVVRGKVDVSAKAPLPGRSSEGGPGGFRGGMVSTALGYDNGLGLGPGGGWTLLGGSYGTVVVANSAENGKISIAPYGSASLMPLVGGSGGGGYGSPDPAIGWGGGGGGAVLVVSRTVLSLDGEIVAEGVASVHGESPGSGGAIRLVADTMAGSGILRAAGKSSRFSISGNGRIRLEAKTSQASYDTVPETIVVPPIESEAIWGRTNLPTAQIVSINGQPVSPDPRGEWTTGVSPDVTLRSPGEVPVTIRCRNLPTNSVVTVRAVLKRNPVEGFGGNKLLNARFVSGDELESTWTAALPPVPGFRMLQVVARSP